MNIIHTKTRKYTDSEVIQRAKEDPEEFKYLYEKYFEPVYKFIYQRLDDLTEADDLTSQVFLKALYNIKKYKDKGKPFKNWLLRIAYNEMMDYFKKNQASRTVNIEKTQVKHIIGDLHDENTEDSMPKLIEIIGNLPEADLQLIEIKYFEQRSYQEIGELINISTTNAKVRTHRLLKKIKGMLKDELTLKE